MVHACGQGNCSTAMGHFPHFIVHMYLAALSKASGCLGGIFSVSMISPFSIVMSRNWSVFPGNQFSLTHWQRKNFISLSR